MIRAEHLLELREKGETTVRGEVSLGDLDDLAKLLKVSRGNVYVSSGAGETLQIHVPLK